MQLIYLFSFSVLMSINERRDQHSPKRLYIPCMTQNHHLHNLPFVREIHKSSVDSPHKGLAAGSLMLSLLQSEQAVE